MRDDRRYRNREAGWLQVGFVALLLLALAYMGKNTLTGDHGLLSLIDRSQEIKVLEIELAEVQTERARMARNVDLLSGPFVDEDLLDERARSELGFTREDEIVIFRDRN